MAKLIPAAKRIEMARDLIDKARELPLPHEGGRFDFNYVAQVKAWLKEARDLVKLVPRTVGIAQETKDDAKWVLEEADRAHQDIFHPPPDQA
jgi:hypothetical protein